MNKEIRVISQVEFEDGKWSSGEFKDQGVAVLWNKPSGYTSHDVVAQVRKKITKVTGEKIKVGHSGTLDPLACGLLIILLGAATKSQDWFMNMDKEYEVEAILGYVSDTYDVDGKVEKQSPEKIEGLEQKQLEEKVGEEIKIFIGEIQQQTPAYAAVKVGGKKLYEYARAGQIVSLPWRQVRIDKVEVLILEQTNFAGGETWRVCMRVKCSSGTYIRSLVHDLGQALGCGAVVSKLRRTKIGEYCL